MDFLKNLKFAWRYAKDQKWRLLVYILGNLSLVVISIVIPVLGARQIVQLTDSALMQFLFTSLLIFVIEMMRNVGGFISRRCSQVIYRETFSNLEVDLGKTILQLENECIDANSSGVFIQRITNDSAKLADIFGILNMYLSNIIIDLGIFGAVFIINKWIFLYMVVMVLILYMVESTKAKRYMARDKIYREKNEKVTGFIGEIVRGVRDIKMLNAERSFIKELDSKIVDLNETRYGMLNSNNRFTMLSSTLRDLFDILLIVLIVYFINNGALSIASALVIINYSGRLPSIVNYFGMLLDKVKDFNLSAERVFDIIAGENFKKEEFGSKHLKKIRGDFEFKNVAFAYNEQDVLKDVSFKIKANETVAFVGKSGAGKTTIFNLLCKMYDVKEGSITIDGVNIEELDRESIRGNITIISQNPYIFNLSIRDNLKLVKEDLSEKEMKKACKMACLDEFIESLPDKYDTVIGEGGVNLSGGQKQRLAIARALVQKTEIILFDEATSALDNETQAKIQEAIDNMKNEYTILIIAHRLSTIINADRIIFLNDGKIEMEGTHKTLLKKCPDYKHLYESEIKK